MTISGTAAAPGSYTVSVKATNLSNKSGVEKSFTITVPNLTCEALPNLQSATDAYTPLTVGVEIADDLVNCKPKSGWSVKVS